MASVLIYSFATAACGFANSVTQLAICRVVLGIGMGGEWASGAALVSETWPKEHRGKALGLMQSAWAIGYAAAAIVTWLVLPIGGWRAVFFVGVLPALLTLWVRRRVEEPAIWREKQQRTPARRARPHERSVRRRPRPRHHRADGDERLLPVRLVGIQPVDSRLSLAARSRTAASASPRARCLDWSSRCRSACGSATSPSASSATPSAAAAPTSPT